MTGPVFTSALFIGTALIALWIFVRFPAAAPSSLTFRAVAPLAAGFGVGHVRVDASDPLHLYGTVFGIAFPLLVCTWVTAIWLLEMLRDAAVTR